MLQLLFKVEIQSSQNHPIISSPSSTPTPFDKKLPIKIMGLARHVFVVRVCTPAHQCCFAPSTSSTKKNLTWSRVRNKKKTLTKLLIKYINCLQQLVTALGKNIVFFFISLLNMVVEQSTPLAQSLTKPLNSIYTTYIHTIKINNNLATTCKKKEKDGRLLVQTQISCF